MSDAVFGPRPRAVLEDPELVRPDPYHDHLRPMDELWLDRGECIDPEFTALAARLLREVPNYILRSYPTPGPLYRKLSSYLGVDENRLCLTLGTDGAIGTVFQTFAEPGDVAVITDPTYQMYEVYARMNGVRVVKVPYRVENGRPSLTGAEIADAVIAHKPRIVGLPYPDNPTGYAFEENEMRLVIDAARRVGALVLVDEAYYPFHPATCLPWVAEYQNLVVTRSFSKAWGLAGIRLGYTVAPPAVNAIFHKIRPMVEANGMSMYLAERILDHEAERNQSIARLIEGRRMLADEIAALGFFTIDTACNFVHVDFGESRDAAAAALIGVARYRVFEGPLLGHFFRFTTTTPPLARRVIDALKPIRTSAASQGSGAT
jgi:histidinol-phosphate aminotransferase